MEHVSETYWALADKADKKFARLRDLPPYGGNKWDTYFHKAFQVYTKLWKYQQENRQKLVEAGLKRWEIGEIASRIGQLYYNYYLRTSDSTFLSESFIFYEAIMSREYFKDTVKDATLANKHLRYYARFIVVCLLLNRREMVLHLIRQLRVLLDEYRSTFQGNEAKEWKRVMQEILRFMKADAPCQNSRPLRYSLRLDPHPNSFPLVARLGGAKPLKLKDAVVASYYHNEVKFTELTLDTFRFLQCLEWEPSGSFYRMKVGDAGSNGSNPGHSGPSRTAVDDIIDQTLPPNPHKYILYRPSIPQLLLVLATACEELPADCILLVYLSASGKPARDGATSLLATPATSSGSDASAPVSTLESTETSSTDATTVDQHGGRGQQMESEIHEASPSGSPMYSPQNVASYASGSRHWSPRNNSAGLFLGSRGNKGLSFLYPGDILPFTRRPLFIVIDSDNSSAFEVIHGEEKGEPAALLLSPMLQPAGEWGSPADSSSHHPIGGNYFTFFLTAPLPAFCKLVGVHVTNLAQVVHEQLEKLLTSLFSDWGIMLSMSTTLDPVWARILWDPFLRQLLLRFILCRACLTLHKRFGNKLEYIPRCLPSLPEEALPTGTAVETGLLRLACRLQVADQFLISSQCLGMESEKTGQGLEDQHQNGNEGDITGQQNLDFRSADSVEIEILHEEQTIVENGQL